MIDIDTSGAPQTPDDAVIERLYEVAVDPSRYEALLDHWEAMISPLRATAGDDIEKALGLTRVTAHVRRADQVLDRLLAAHDAAHPAAIVAEIDRTAAFAVDRGLTIVAVNTAAARLLGVTRGARVADLALADGEAADIAARIDRLLRGGDAAPLLIRAHCAMTDRMIAFHLRLVRPSHGTTFVIAATSELLWPPGFPAILRNAFNLTPAEAEVMQALAEGRSLNQIAETRGRSIATVRAQVKSVMAKTETRSQSELVRLTLSIMEMAHSIVEAGKAMPETSQGFAALVPRRFQTMTCADGRRFDYLVLGDPTGRPCLYLPLNYGLVRWPASAEAEAVRRGIRIVVPVRPGFGASTPLPRDAPYMRQCAKDLMALLDHLGITSVPVITLGGDSHFGMALHALAPERVRALICCAGVLPLTTPEQYERMDKWHRFILAGARYTPHVLPFLVKAGFAQARRMGKRAFVHAVYGKSNADVATFEIDEVFEAMVCGSDVALSDTHSSHDAFAREVVAQETGDWQRELALLRDSATPVHFLNGLQDPQVPPATLTELRDAYPWIDFQLYPDAGQLLFFLKWRDVMTLTERYLGPPDNGPDKII
jgi:pimeloyl-ACP methyl ester carboxylesterase/DNA-binding CsgD family transcriptional regulator/PAS domain-containing protein